MRRRSSLVKVLLGVVWGVPGKRILPVGGICMVVDLGGAEKLSWVSSLGQVA